jgi:hypothetical protein
MQKFFSRFLNWYQALYAKMEALIAELVEVVGWQYRGRFLFALIFVIICFVAYQIISVVLPYLNNGKEELTNKAYTFIFSIILFIIIEIYIYLKNLFPNIITPGIRIFAALAYVPLLMQLTSNYYEYAIIFYKGIFNAAQYSIFEKYLESILQFYADIPFRDNLDQASFYIYYLGIGRNRDTFTYFVRYSYVQEITYRILVSFISFVFSLCVQTNLFSDEIRIYVGLFIYSFSAFVLFSSAIYCFLGTQPKIPVIHTAIEYHVGKKKKN